jgi:broad specificity phosphatase PhoE
LGVCRSHPHEPLVKPNRIILVRHGQSEGNVDKRIYATKPDWTIELTSLGWQQADACGKEIKRILGNENAFWYYSPYFRTRQTYMGIRRYFSAPYEEYSDLRIREQDWGNLRNGDLDYNAIEEERDGYGHLFYHLPGESCASVFDRVGGFLETMHRDFEKRTFPQNAIIVSHGMTNRVFLMRWFHFSIERFEELANPSNCGLYVLELNRTTGKYTLQGEWRLDPETLKYEVLPQPKTYPAPRHPFRFDWNKCPLPPVAS